MAVLTDKELSMVEEQLRAEKLAITKFSMYATQCEDKKLADLCTAAARKHKEHYQMLMDQVKSAKMLQ